jgi:folate-binding protein YgfZ
VIATAEYELVTEGAGALERPDRAKLLLSGAEAAEFLQGQVTNDVEGLEPGEGCYAALLTHKGKIRTDLRILRGDQWLWLDAAEIGRRPLVHTVQTYSLGRDVRSEDVTEERTILSLIGPAAREALETAPPEREHSFVTGEHGLYVATDVGVDVICESQDREGVRAALGVEPVSEQVAECLRIERGRPRLGLDMDDGTIPEEAGLNERAVSFTKGCYVGQETVARLHYRGKPNRHLRGLRLSSPASAGEPIHLGERQVGTVGSACESPRLGSIALAVLRREAAPGETVSVGDAGEAEVVDLPFPSG